MAATERTTGGAVLAREVVLEHGAAYDDGDRDRYAATLHPRVELVADTGVVRGRDAVVAAAWGARGQWLRAGERSTIVAESGDTVVVESWAPGGHGSAVLHRVFQVAEGRIVQLQRILHTGSVLRRVVAPHDEPARLAAEQSALRRLATLVAQGVPEIAVFAVANLEIARLMDADATSLLRFDDDDTVTTVAAWSRTGAPLTLGERRPLDEPLRRARERRSATRFGPAEPPDETTYAEEAQAAGIRSSVGVPIFVDGRVWGMSFVASTGAMALPEDTEIRLRRFADLLSTAMASAQARSDLQRLADQQAALRRVAEVVAGGAEPERIFELVVKEAYELLGASFTSLVRFGPDGSSEKIALHHAPALLYAGQRAPADEDGVVQRIRRTGRTVRVDDLDELAGAMPALGRELGVTAVAGAPITVDGRTWGALVAFVLDGRLAAGIEERLDELARLVGVAIAGAAARAELHELADEQASLRRVAELIAREADPETVFAAVADESSALLAGRPTVLVRFDGDGWGTVVANSTAEPESLGRRFPLTAGLARQVAQTGETCRVDDYGDVPRSDMADEFGVRAAVATPVLTGGHVWGMLLAASRDAPLPPDSEDRLQQYGELLAAAVASAENRAQLRASRARIAASADDARHRLQRDVHDGAQQRLVHTVMTLQIAEQRLAGVAGASEGLGLVREARGHARRATEELRDVVRGILPAALTHGGLRAGVQSLVDDLPLPVEVDVRVDRLPSALETTAYFVVAEALTNVVKHADATRASVAASVADGQFVVRVGDDGCGGARLQEGGGLIGLVDRVEAGDGMLRLESAADAGTVLEARWPLPLAP